MAVYQGARPRSGFIGSGGRRSAFVPGADPRATGDLPAPARARRCGPVDGRDGSGSCSAASSSRSSSRSSRWPRTCALTTTGYDMAGLQSERDRLDATTQDLVTNINRLGSEPGDPQAGPRRRPHPARRAHRRAGSLSRRPTDAGPDRLAPSATSRSSSVVRGRRRCLVGRLAWWQVVRGADLAADARRADDDPAHRALAPRHDLRPERHGRPRDLGRPRPARRLAPAAEPERPARARPRGWSRCSSA